MKLSRFSSRSIAVLAFGLGLALGPGRAIAQRPMGTDVSSYQGSGINWTAVKNDGVSFAWAKAAEGTPAHGYGEDADYTINEANAPAAGIYIGSYYYAHPELDTGTSGADTEAAYFWSVASTYMTGAGMYLSPQLDMEVDTGTQTSQSAWVNEWCQDIVNDGAANGVTIKPCVYSSTSYAADYYNSSVTQWTAWLADYPDGVSGDAGSPCPQTCSPNSSTPWSTWNLWQYGDTNWSGGDSDVFNGTMSQFLQLCLIKNTLAITAQPVGATVPLGGSATFSVTATGSGSLSYQWALNSTNISGATLSHYTVNNVQFTNAGGYTVKVTDNTGNILSAAAFLAIQTPLTNAPGAIVAPPGILNWWPADWNSLDILGGNNGTPQGSLTYVPGLQNMAFHFDGSTAVISNGTASLLSSAWTACLWVNCQYAPQLPAVLLADSTAALVLQQKGTGLGGTQGAHEVGVTVSGVNYDFSPAYIVPTNTWTHLAFVENSSGISVYVNGALQGSLTNTFSLPRGFIGATYSSTSTNYVDFMLGNLDNIMTFNVALSAAQINAIYSAGSAGLICVPVITGVAFTGSNQCTVDLEGQTGKYYSIYFSTNLSNWTLIENDLLNTQGTNQFIDNSATNSQKYYRVSQTY